MESARRRFTEFRSTTSGRVGNPYNTGSHTFYIDSLNYDYDNVGSDSYDDVQLC